MKTNMTPGREAAWESVEKGKKHERLQQKLKEKNLCFPFSSLFFFLFFFILPKEGFKNSAKGKEKENGRVKQNKATTVIYVQTYSTDSSKDGKSAAQFEEKGQR